MTKDEQQVIGDIITILFCSALLKYCTPSCSMWFNWR